MSTAPSTPPAMPGLAGIQDQPGAVACLQTALRNGRMPSALLFLGPPHSGKRTTALALASALNCLQPRPGPTSCGSCAPCRKIAADVHPDVSVISPEGRFVKIDQIRTLIQRFNLPAYEGQQRVIILAGAENMHEQTANAFLKTLEEPPLDSTLVLCATTLSTLPSTIASRCALLHFGPLGAEAVRTQLRTHFPELPPDALDFAVRFSQGCMRYNLAENASLFMELRQNWAQLLASPRRASIVQGLALCTQSAAAESWRFVLEWLETWLRDVRLLQAEAAQAQSSLAQSSQAQPAETQHTPQLLNADLLPALQSCARALSAAAAERLWRELLAARSEIMTWNVSKALRFQAFLLAARAA